MRAVKEVQEQMAASGAARAEGAAGTVKRMSSYPARTRQFLHDVRMEMRNVTWPSRRDVQSTTVVVLLTSFFFGFYLGMALDVPIARIMHWLLRVGRSLLG
jgi:preprotein translocase subunit SecE